MHKTRASIKQTESQHGERGIEHKLLGVIGDKLLEILSNCVDG